MKHAVLFVSSIALCFLLVPSRGLAEGAPKVKIQEAEIYLGDPVSFEKPAVVDVDAVYARIPEYKEIVDKNLTSDDPRYMMLMRTASEKFMSALSAAASEKGFDLVGGLGSISIEGRTVPDITRLVISKLRK